MNNSSPRVRLWVWIAASLCFVFGAGPLLTCSPGLPNLLLVGLGGVILLLYYFGNRLPHILRSLIFLFLAVLFLFCSALTAVMVHASYFDADPTAAPQTIVVLSCAARNRKPSRMLRRRLDAAYTYLCAHPQAVAILTGGTDLAHDYSDAEIMQEYLVARGIDPARLYLEEKAASTYENFRFSYALAQQHGLDTRIAVATDRFHQWRAAHFAADTGFILEEAVPCRTEFFIAPLYYVREWLAIIKYWIFRV